MVKQKVEDIFAPGKLPSSTYITRKSKMGFTYEQRLQTALSIGGFLTLISGQSKIGKTVLCEKVVGLEHLIKVSGADFKHEDNLWSDIGAKAGMPVHGETRTGDEKEAMKESYKLTKERVIAYYQEHEYILLLDDFHYADPAMQIHMAQQFKDAIQKGFKVIIVSLPHRSDDAIRRNPDLQGRISIINIEPWTKEELEEIPRTGFKELNIEISDKIVDRLVQESLCSPHLMQRVCLNICTLKDTDHVDVKKIDEDVVEMAFKLATLNLDYEEVAATIRQGKYSRGKSRKKFLTWENGELDLYELILLSIAIDPLQTNLKFDELLERVHFLVKGEEKPTARALREYLKNLQDVLNEKGRAFEVIEWKDDTLYILEPLFLFCLRWGEIM